MRSIAFVLCILIGSPAGAVEGGGARVTLDHPLLAPLRPAQGFDCRNVACTQLGSCAEACHKLLVCGQSQRDGDNDGIPGILGWPEEDFVVAMHAYKEKVRPHPVMRMMAGRLANDEIAALAAYFGGLE